ncbi:hypothetical protein VVD49_16215 [Uliginosibacterium sp. H3]|uniref:Uncharacterized protein n=1 Tax=Uliginosibacterium silvisoli TaxID=3114758 RepID=A0ABU6K7N2_9RHOO|nr:hypothetical protein [Uliginosibacterium sp. H3]
MLGRILGVLGVPVLVVGLLWLGAVIYFQQAETDVSSVDIVIWFALVPLAAVVAWFIGKALHTRSKTPPAETAAAPDSPASPEKDDRLSLQLAILSAEVNTAAGESAADLLGAMRKGDIRPGFNERLFDADGMPVKTSSHDALATDEYLPWVEKWLRSADNASDLNPEDGARLLALLDPPLNRTLEVLASLPALTEAGTGTHKPSQEPQLRPLATKIFTAPVWQEMISTYVRTQVAQAGGLAFGIVRADADRPELQADAMRVADAFCKASTEAYSSCILMIVACDSLTAQAQVDVLEANGLLFTSANQAGFIPGEGAAVILAAPPALVGADTPPLASLHRAAFGAREKPVDAQGRIDAAHLQELGNATLTNAELQTSSVAGLISDCDHRSPWLTEAAMLINASLSELDPVADHLALGNALGSTGHASSTLALAFAAHAIAIDEKPLLVASLTDKRARSIVALSPWQAPAAAPITPATANQS